MNTQSQQFRRLTISLIIGLILVPGQAQGVYTNAPGWLSEGGVPIGVPVGLDPSQTGGGPPVSTISVGATNLTNLRPQLAGATNTVRVGLISSGVDKSLFPETLGSQITGRNIDLSDTVGYGSYAASALLQLAGANNGVTTTVSISSYNVYPSGSFSPTTLIYALDWMYQNASNLDVVLLGFPPTDFLDPITAAMSNDSWNKVIDAMLGRPSSTPDGPVLGIPLEGNAFNEQGDLEYNFVNSLRLGMKNFDLARRWIEVLNTKGLSVVMAAGDVGPNPQTVMGLANLPSVITVGGYNPAGQISPKSASGPSIDLKVKPDLLAPTGIVGVMPPSSTLAKLLKASSSLKPDRPDYPAWTPSATARADTTLSASTVAAMAAGALGASGLRNPKLQRGALYAASTHIEGAAIWRQASGVLGGVSQTVSMPTATSTTIDPLVLNHGDLGFQPEGTWNTTVTVSTGTVTGATVTLTDFIGVDLLGKATTGTASANDPPQVTATVTSAVNVVLNAIAAVTATVTGHYCGTLKLDLAGATGTVGETPVCLTTGFEPLGRISEIHNQSANNDSFMLMPALPIGATVLDHPLALLPIDPTNFGLVTAISQNSTCQRFNTATVIDFRETCDGHARLPKVMSGYYRIREFADYGGQTESTVTNSSTGATETVGRDLGRPIIYSSFDTLLLPRDPRCEENFGKWEDWAGHGDPVLDERKWKYCTDSVFDDAKALYETSTVNVETAGQLYQTATVKNATFKAPYNRFLGGYDVSLTRDETRTVTSTVTDTVSATVTSSVTAKSLVNMGFFRKFTEGANIGRVIDIIDPCKDMSTKTFYSDQITSIQSIVSSTVGNGPWQFGCLSAPNGGLGATLLGSSGGSASVGWATAEYPFNIPTPNFGAHMSLNFAYNLTNSFIVVAVIMGPDIRIGFVTSAGTFQFPPGVPTIDTSQVPAVGQAEGKANFEFNLNPKGWSRGKILFAIAPSSVTAGPVYQYPTYISKAAIQDSPANNQTLSFELSTFEVNDWPAVNYPNRGIVETRQDPCPNAPLDCGHLFTLNSQYNPYTTDVPTGTWTGGQIGKWDPSSSSVTPNCRIINNGTRKATVCEDWSMIVHSPKMPVVVPSGIPGNPTLPQYQTATGASLMDVLDFSSPTQTSIVQELIDKKGRLYVPAPRYTTQTVILAHKYLPPNVPRSLFSRTLKSNGTHFELLNFPIDVLEKHPRDIGVCINDGTARPETTYGDGAHSSSICRGYRDASNNWVVTDTAVSMVPKVTTTAGAKVPLRPYVPYAQQATLWYWPAPPPLPEPPP
ncbi:MAG: S8 family serine peptidase [Actinomycetota bacterium]